MRTILLAAAATVVIATPAVARDGSPYVGIEGGVTWPKSQDLLGGVTFTTTTPTGPTNFTTTTVGSNRYKRGYDVDLIGGYDLGMFRLEGELGYKRAKIKNRNFSNTFLTAINTGAGTTFTTTTATGSTFGLPSKTSVWSAMGNALLDLGGNGGIGGYVGAGAGYAKVKQFGSSKGKFAWQLLAGAYMPLGGNVDLGLKYRYFRAGRSNGNRDFAFAAGATTCGVAPNTFACSPGTATFSNNGRYSSHSLLLSLVYNFAAPAAVPAAAPAPPPPPPPAAPATQTCPDGSVIEATAACPAPPPPPPPPPPATRGERG